VRALIRKLLAIGPLSKPATQHVEQLAHAILDYGLLIRHEFPEKENVVINTREIAYRFRERPQDVTKAMLFLEAKGQAKHAQGKGEWFIDA
jgi:hypothetical protein